ncbi:MAG: PQQ-like beta-propeller repeat protein [Anaerolineae bacterium]|nr:PQQ-like beta-propeller repeat protein [Anaerolineae bacterium]
MTGNFIAAGSQVYASAAVGEALVYVTAYEGDLYALDRATGAQVWAQRVGRVAYSSPTLVGDVVYALGEGEGKLYAFDAATGAPLWEVVTGREGDYRSSSPVWAGDTLYIGSNTEGLLAYRADGQ